LAIEALGIYPNQQGASIGTSKRIYPSDSAPNMEVRFQTQSDTWVKANVWVTVDAINKNGKEAVNSWTYVGEGGVTDKATSWFAKVSVGDYFEWQKYLSNIIDSSTLLGTLTYASRKYDCIRLTVKVRCYFYANDGVTLDSVVSDPVYCYIGFIPTYTVDANGIYLDKDGLTIDYTATGWNRPNDRWAIKNLKDGTKTVIGSTEVYGTVGKYGKITIPKDKLLYVPKQGDTLTGTARMVGSWQETGTTLNTLDLSTQTVIDKYTLKDPTLTVTTDDAGVHVTVGQTGTGTSLDYVEVSMVGGEYGADRVKIPVGGTYVFKAYPFGTVTEWQAVGYSNAPGEEVSASKVVTQNAAKIDKDGLALVGTNVYWFMYNVRYTTSSKPAYATAKLAGRNRPTVGFGEGGMVTWQVEGILAMPEISSLGVVTADEQSYRELPTEGVYVMCLPDGQRAQVFISNMSITRDNTKLRTVSFTAEEVAEWIGE